MNEQKIRELVIATARDYIGRNEDDGSHKQIIDIYNSQRPLPRGYKVKYTDAWCATFVSAIGVKLGMTDILLPECSCPKMITLYKNAGRWEENDAYVPSIGDLMMYDWDDTGRGENKNDPEHVGIVESVSGNKIVVIEGNYFDSVSRREMSVNGKYIRGYCKPNYAKKADKPTPAPAPKPAPVPTPVPAPTPTAYVPSVLEWQKAAIADGYKFPKYGADGKWGSECESVAKKAVVKKRTYYTNKNLTRIVQKVVGVAADGLCGNATKNAIIAYQKKNGLTADGAVGLNTWKKMLGVK